MSKTYDHAFTIAFSVQGSTHPEGEDLTRDQYRAALMKRINELYREDAFGEAVGLPFDTFEESE